ncbi:MAG: hypothetical protein ACJAZ0_002016 [Halioglobus sp.]|jgi:hypothetical protein
MFSGSSLALVRVFGRWIIEPDKLDKPHYATAAAAALRRSSRLAQY